MRKLILNIRLEKINLKFFECIFTPWTDKITKKENTHIATTVLLPAVKIIKKSKKESNQEVLCLKKKFNEKRKKE